MKKTHIALWSVLTITTTHAQQQFSIRGNVTLLSKSKNISLAGFDPVPVRADGSFKITGTLKEAQIALLRTDSSGACSIWLEPGEYSLTCEEITIEGVKGVLLRTPGLNGPENSKLYNDFVNQEGNGFGIKAQEEEDRESIKTRKKNRVLQYMDSLLSTNDTAPVLANMVRSAQFYVGDEATKKLIQKLSPALRNSDEISILTKDFKRKAKIAEEKQFENFTMKDTNDKEVSLASVKGKKAILLDFWSSHCGPCRATHPKLITWYQKYKDKGLEIISISVDTKKEEWIAAVKKDGIEKWINVSELKGWKTSLMTNYFISFIPFKFLLDDSMNIVKVENMATSWIEEKDIAALLDKE